MPTSVGALSLIAGSQIGSSRSRSRPGRWIPAMCTSICNSENSVEILEIQDNMIFDHSISIAFRENM